MAKKFLTLDIGAANVALAEYESSGKGSLTLVNYGIAALQAPLDAGDAATILSPALLEIVREKGIKPGPVAISVTGQMVFPRFAAIPFAGGEEKFEQMIRYEIEQNVPFPIDEMVCDRQVLGDTETGDKAVMIVAAKNEQIEAITDAVTGAGFTPMSVDAAPIAVVNAVRAAAGDADSCVIMLDIGAKTTSLVISEGDKVYNRSIPTAGNNITRDIAQALGCTTEEAEQLKREKGYVALGGVVEDEDEVADRISKVCRTVMTRILAEVSRSVNFYRGQQGGSAPTRLYLTGGTALLPQVDRFFQESLQIEVAYLNPLEFISAKPSLDADKLGSDVVQLAATAGLALNAAGLARFSINLLPESIVEARAEKAKVPVVAVAGVLLLAALAVVWVATVRSSDALKERLESVQGRQSELQNYETKIRKAAERVVAAKADADALRELLASRSAQVTRLNAVRNALGGGMWIEKWEKCGKSAKGTARTDRVTIRGWKDNLEKFAREDAAKRGGKSRQASEIVESRLKQSAAVNPESVKIADSKSVGKNSEVTEFSVELGFK